MAKLDQENKQSSENNSSPNRKRLLPTAWRARLAGIILIAFPVIAFIRFVNFGAPLHAFFWIFLLTVLAIGVGLVFKSKLCWYLTFIINIFFLFAGLSRFGEFSAYKQQASNTSISPWVISYLILPYVIGLILLLSDRPKKWL